MTYNVFSETLNLALSMLMMTDDDVTKLQLTVRSTWQHTV